MNTDQAAQTSGNGKGAEIPLRHAGQETQTIAFVKGCRPSRFLNKTHPAKENARRVAPGIPSGTE
ncbi:hypothetical protein [Mesorhizobium sp. 1M-11]|uniref:hypothetical protein n=1 Tax=Mesorhizobium sp. 1M-11 TaxID=1529006 RepID=UPI00128EFF6B|nr:hypothetical protein [Mesorhizobium sp. 1M-11]